MEKRNLKIINLFILLRGYYRNDDSCFFNAKINLMTTDLPCSTRKNFLTLELKHRVTYRASLTHWWLHVWCKIYSFWHSMFYF